MLNKLPLNSFSLSLDKNFLTVVTFGVFTLIHINFIIISDIKKKQQQFDALFDNENCVFRRYSCS